MIVPVAADKISCIEIPMADNFVWKFEADIMQNPAAPNAVKRGGRNSRSRACLASAATQHVVAFVSIVPREPHRSKI